MSFFVHRECVDVVGIKVKKELNLDKKVFFSKVARW